MTGKLLKVLAGVGALLLVSLAMSAPVFAGGKNKAGGDSGYTEDNDSNDNGTMNNVSDDGDNAHPSGKDRSVENGKSGNQGKSGSDPDGDSNGGADKPNGSGGTDKADQDGNNGCGNDDDFEDDNNGNCGPKDKTKPCVPHGKSQGKGKSNGKGRADDCVEGTTTTPDCVEDMTTEALECDEDGDAVLGDDLEDGDDADEGDEVLGDVIGGGSNDEGDEVLGDTLTNDEAAAAADREAGAALPFTGAAILTIVALGVGLLGTGALVMRSRRKTHI